MITHCKECVHKVLYSELGMSFINITKENLHNIGYYDIYQRRDFINIKREGFLGGKGGNNWVTRST